MKAETKGKRGFVYLASSSPRRRELLAQLGLSYKVVPAEIDECRLPAEAPQDYVRRVALAKGRAVLSSGGHEDAPIVAADTAVVVGDDIFGKPADDEDARRMLGRLSGRVHEVLSAVAVMNSAGEEVAVQRSTVRFRKLTEAQIDRYVSGGEQRDKAGAYAIQGLGAVFIEELTGSYSGVMGLPLCETARLLAGFGYCLP